jgi:hypothetical protein
MPSYEDGDDDRIDSGPLQAVREGARARAHHIHPNATCLERRGELEDVVLRDPEVGIADYLQDVHAVSGSEAEPGH